MDIYSQIFLRKGLPSIAHVDSRFSKEKKMKSHDYFII